MGTSKNRDKLRPSIPLIPDWIDVAPVPAEPAELPGNQNPDGNEQQDENQLNIPDQIPPGNRFYQIQREFRKGVRADDINRPLFTHVVKNYVRQGGGGSRVLAQRMRRSASSVVRFGGIINDIRRNGVENTLASLNLQQFAGRSVVDILSALIDVVCGAGAILDDAITKTAYANAIVRIDEQNLGLDLGTLDQAQANEMIAIFIEETIVYRLLSDVGRSLTVSTSDFEKARGIEEEIYQIVNGLVNGTIVPLLNTAITTNTLQERIDSIYETAFNTIING